MWGPQIELTALLIPNNFPPVPEDILLSENCAGSPKLHKRTSDLCNLRHVPGGVEGALEFPLVVPPEDAEHCGIVCSI